MTSAITIEPQILLSTARDPGYYRSKIFNTDIGINPLMAAASPLFSLSVFLSDQTVAIDSPILHQALVHEIKVFETQAKAQRYHSETILAARFLLCAFLDEIVGDRQSDSLLQFFHQEHDSGEKFFILLDKLSQDPELHSDLLELIYLCLNFGYLGQYRDNPQGKIIVEQIAQKLFRDIRRQREASHNELKKELLITPPGENCPPAVKFAFPLWLMLSFTLAVILTIYSSFSYKLSNHAKILYQQINTLMTPQP